LTTNFRAVADAEIAKYSTEIQELDAKVRSEVKGFVDRCGIDIIECSYAVHCCSCHFQSEYVQLLLDFVPDTKKKHAVNSLDEHGRTALMVAATSSQHYAENIGMREYTCQFLIDVGADRGISGVEGLSALGRFRETFRDRRDFYMSNGIHGCSLWQAELAVVASMERTLLPVGGPTQADEFLRLSMEEEEDSSDGEDDESSEEDEEEE